MLGSTIEVPAWEFKHNCISFMEITLHHLLKLLPYANQAAFNTSNKQHASECLRDATDEKCIFWLSGMARTGKLTIVHTIAREYRKEGRLGANFFFSRGGGDLGSAGKVFIILARELAELSSDFEGYICEAVSKKSNIGSLGLQTSGRSSSISPFLNSTRDCFQSC